MKVILCVGLAALVLSSCGGSNGATGATGAMGATGAAGTSGDVFSSGKSCSAFDGGSGTLLQYVYESVLYASGSRLVTCQISNGSQGYTNSVYYKSGQTGNSTGACSVQYGLSTTDFGEWNFTTTGVSYSDSGSGHNNYSYTFSGGNCSTF